MQANHQFHSKPKPAPVTSAPLTLQQCRLLRELLRGRTLTEAARDFEIPRSIIHRWLKQDDY